MNQVASEVPIHDRYLSELFQLDQVRLDEAMSREHERLVALNWDPKAVQLFQEVWPLLGARAEVAKFKSLHPGKRELLDLQLPEINEVDEAVAKIAQDQQMLTARQRQHLIELLTTALANSQSSETNERAIA